MKITIYCHFCVICYTIIKIKLKDCDSMADVTLEQYEALPENRRVEIFDGVIYDMASPSQIHQSLSMELSNTLYNYLKNKKGSCQVFSAPFDVKLSDNPLTIVQPDIMVICDKDKLDGPPLHSIIPATFKNAKNGRKKQETFS